MRLIFQETEIRHELSPLFIPLYCASLFAIPAGFEIQQFAIYTDANMTVFILYLKHI